MKDRSRDKSKDIERFKEWLDEWCAENPGIHEYAATYGRSRGSNPGGIYCINGSMPGSNGGSFVWD